MTCRWCGCKLLPSEISPTAKVSYCESCRERKLRAARKWRRSASGKAWCASYAKDRRDTRIAAGLCERCPAAAAPGRRACALHLEADKVRQSMRPEVRR